MDEAAGECKRRRMTVLAGHGSLLEGSMSATSAEVNSVCISMRFKSAIDVGGI